MPTLSKLASALAGCCFASAVHADQSGIICSSATDAIEFVRILDGVPRPFKVNDVFDLTRAKGVKCTIVYATFELKGIVDETLPPLHDFAIVRVMVNDRNYFSFFRQKGTRV